MTDSHIENKKIRVIRPTCQATCSKMNYIERENKGNITLQCTYCRDKTACINES